MADSMLVVDRYQPVGRTNSLGIILTLFSDIEDRITDSDIKTVPDESKKLNSTHGCT